jgi:hypothetical protein
LASASTPEQNPVPPYQHTPPHIDRVRRPCAALVKDIERYPGFWNLIISCP